MSTNCRYFFLLFFNLIRTSSTSFAFNFLLVISRLIVFVCFSFAIEIRCVNVSGCFIHHDFSTSIRFRSSGFRMLLFTCVRYSFQIERERKNIRTQTHCYIIELVINSGYNWKSIQASKADLTGCNIFILLCDGDDRNERSLGV